jgi:Zn-dependent protease
MGSNISPTEIVSLILVLFLGIGIHEYAHCKFADLAGDPTPRYYGRVTLNLFKHFEPMGTLMMVLSSITGYGLGWGRAAPMDPNKMRNPRWDFFIAVLAGPVSNLCQAVIYAVFFRIALTNVTALSGETGRFVVTFLLMGIEINLRLCMFNLIPFGPLDGGWLLGLLMPERPRLQWFLFNRKIGFAGLFIFVIVISRVPAAERVFNAPINAAMKVLLPRMPDSSFDSSEPPSSGGPQTDNPNSDNP